MDKRVAPDKEGATVKQCIGKGLFWFHTRADGACSLFRQVHLEGNSDIKPGRRFVTWHQGQGPLSTMRMHGKVPGDSPA